MAPRGRGLDLKHRIRRHHPLGALMRRQLTRLETASAEELRDYQERRLRRLVALAAARSPYYREWFAESGIEPGEIRTLDDLTKLPLLDRSLLVDRAADFLTYPKGLVWSVRSSGTSGTTITSYRTAGSSIFEMCAQERQWRWFGVSAESRRVVLRGSDFVADQPDSVVKELPGARQLLLSSYHLTPDRLDEVMAHLRAFDPVAIEGWPSSISLLAAQLRDRGMRFPVRAVITSSEVMSPGQRRLIEEVFAAPIVDHYGQTERVAMAGNCAGGGFHIFPDYGIVELLPVPGTVDRWEIVGTPLHNWGFPLFRYRTGDEVGPAPTQPCGCGRSFPLIGEIDGRIEDSFSTVDGRVLPLPSTVLDSLEGLREAQIVQLSPGSFEVRVVPGVGFDEERTWAQIRANVDRLFGEGQSVSVRTLSALPRPASGKLKNAVVERAGESGSSGLA